MIKKAVWVGLLTCCLVFCLTLLKWQDKAGVSAMSREGVITEIQKLARLQSVAFAVDTVIIAQKDGTWQKLWQDEQKGLFVAKGRVLAGVDLSKITPEMVSVSHQQTGQNSPPNAHINITLPPSEVFEVLLDDIAVYDWQTGAFGLVDNDPEILARAQASAKTEVLNKACQGEILKMAQHNASEQVAGLFLLTGATVQVTNQGTGACRF